MECSSCEEKFADFQNYEQHMQSEKHKKNIMNTQETQNDSCVNSENDYNSSDSRNIGRMECIICDLIFDSLEKFQNHSATAEHALKVMHKQVKSNEIQLPNSILNNYGLNTTKCNVESTTEENVLPELNDNKSCLSYGKCDVCSKIFSGIQPYKQHLDSQAHKKKVALQQNTGYIEGNVILKCEPCNKSFSGQVPYAQHMASETHKKKLQNIQNVEKFLGIDTSNSPAGVNEKEDENKLWFCNICSVQCSGLIPYEQHMAGSIHFKNEKRMQIQNDFAKMNISKTPIMQVSNFSDEKVFEKSQAIPQLMNGNSQIDNRENQNNSIKKDSIIMQAASSNICNTSEKSESMSPIVNGIYQKNVIRQDDSVFPEKSDELKIVSSEELGQLIKIISPDEKIDFDEMDKSKDSANENTDIIKSEDKKDEELHRNFEKGYENGLGDSFKKLEEEKPEVYQTCKICNVSLFDKESASEHFESKEHFVKRWNSSV